MNHHDKYLNYIIKRNMQEVEEKLVRDLIYGSPSSLDENDPAIIAYDREMRGLTAKDLIAMYPRENE